MWSVYLRCEDINNISCSLEPFKSSLRAAFNCEWGCRNRIRGEYFECRPSTNDSGAVHFEQVLLQIEEVKCDEI